MVLPLAFPHFLRVHFLHIILTCWLTHQREYCVFYFPGPCRQTLAIVFGILFAITLLITLFLFNRLIKLKKQNSGEPNNDEMALNDAPAYDQPDNRMA